MTCHEILEKINNPKRKRQEGIQIRTFLIRYRIRNEEERDRQERTENEKLLESGLFIQKEKV